MKKLERLDEARAPDGTVLTLFRHDGAYSIRVDGAELMSTRRHQSEERLAALVCRPLRHRREARVLIGGLGFGFTLKAALHALGPEARVVVAELVAGVVAWNTNPLYELAGPALADRRVELRLDDVARVLKESRRMFDAIMLDVDNGADALTHAGNAQLYQRAGIRTAKAALRPGGVLAYWSAQGDAAFEQSLRDVGLTVEVLSVHAHAASGPRHTLFLARDSTQSESAAVVSRRGC